MDFRCERLSSSPSPNKEALEPSYGHRFNLRFLPHQLYFLTIFDRVFIKINVFQRKRSKPPIPQTWILKHQSACVPLSELYKQRRSRFTGHHQYLIQYFKARISKHNQQTKKYVSTLQWAENQWNTNKKFHFITLACNSLISVPLSFSPSHSLHLKPRLLALEVDSLSAANSAEANAFAKPALISARTKSPVCLRLKQSYL